MSARRTTARTGVPNTVRPLSFSGEHVAAELVTDVREHRIEGRAIVVNTGVTDVLAGESPRRPIPPLSSTTLVDTVVDHADALVVLRPATTDEAAMKEIVQEPGWHLLGDLLGKDGGETGGRPFDRSVPLWKGPQDHVGTVRLAPARLLRETTAPVVEEDFDVLVNLWFAPAGTDCFIHCRHDFLEVHTQVTGRGRMQKFREQDHGTLYEDVLMSPGWTTPDPFCVTYPDGSFHYPWHQYYADTDCVWLAVEYHRNANRSVRTV